MRQFETALKSDAWLYYQKQSKLHDGRNFLTIFYIVIWLLRSFFVVFTFLWRLAFIDSFVYTFTTLLQPICYIFEYKF